MVYSLWGRSFCFRPHVYLCVGHGAVLAGVSPVIELWITYPFTVNVIKRENVSGKEVIITGKIQRADRSPYQQFHRKIQTGAGPGDEKLLLRYENQKNKRTLKPFWTPGRGKGGLCISVIMGTAECRLCKRIYNICTRTAAPVRR